LKTVNQISIVNIIMIFLLVEVVQAKRKAYWSGHLGLK
jgi:hypothetical protein